MNAFLHPSMERFLFNAERKLRTYRNRNPLLIYRNDGSTTRVAKTIAVKTYSSGPRGGIEGTAVLTRHYDIDHAVSMDIGGTTTDIAVFSAGKCPEQRLGEIEGVRVSLPLAQVRSIGVGGSSILRVERGVIVVRSGEREFRAGRARHLIGMQSRAHSGCIRRSLPRPTRRP